jgi:hypothetical protein
MAKPLQTALWRRLLLTSHGPSIAPPQRDHHFTSTSQILREAILSTGLDGKIRWCIGGNATPFGAPSGHYESASKRWPVRTTGIRWAASSVHPSLDFGLLNEG